jgi:predicted transcriptional regulator
MSVEILRSLIASTELRSGGLRVKLDSERLKRLTAESGYSITHLARAANLSLPTLTSAVRGGWIMPKSAFRIADALSRRQSAPARLFE